MKMQTKRHEQLQSHARIKNICQSRKTNTQTPENDTTNKLAVSRRQFFFIINYRVTNARIAHYTEISRPSCHGTATAHNFIGNFNVSHKDKYICD